MTRVRVMAAGIHTKCSVQTAYMQWKKLPIRRDQYTDPWKLEFIMVATISDSGGMGALTHSVTHSVTHSPDLTLISTSRLNHLNPPSALVSLSCAAAGHVSETGEIQGEGDIALSVFENRESMSQLAAKFQMIFTGHEVSRTKPIYASGPFLTCFFVPTVSDRRHHS